MEPKRTITKEEKEYLLSLKPKDITKTLLNSLFTDTYDVKAGKIKKSKFNTYDEFTLNAGEYFNKEKIVTNCGLFIFNKFTIEPRLSHELGYCNTPLDKKGVGAITAKLDAALLEDRIATEDYIDFINRETWLAFTMNTELSTSLTIKSMEVLPAVEKEKSKLLKENKKAMDQGDIPTAIKIEKRLLEVAKDELKSDPSIELYESGARGAFDVAYKTGQIMQGPVYNASTGKFEVVTTPLSRGIRQTDVATLGNSVVGGSYSKAIAPGECGYMTKKLIAAYQSVQLDKAGSDCGTKGYMDIVLTKDNYDFYTYNFIIEGSKLVRLDPSLKDKYVGKRVKLRVPDYCIGKKKICNKCAGDKYYLLGMTAIGLTVPRISNSMLQARMKVFHDPTVKTHEMSPDDFL